jgi:hypothetical protein
MEPSEALGTAAQVAVALAGFAGVVVAFRSGALHEWQPIDKLRLRLLLNNSIVPLILCMIAMLLLSVRPEPPWIWRACSVLALVLTIPLGVVMSRSPRSPESPRLEFSGPPRLLFVSFGVLGVGAMALQIYNMAILNAFWAFYATVVLQLITGAIQFVRLILIQPEPSP